MLTQERAEKLSGILLADKERGMALLNLEANKAVEQINALGNDFTADELREFGKAMTEVSMQGELDADDLDSVAGGGIKQIWGEVKNTARDTWNAFGQVFGGIGKAFLG